MLLRSPIHCKICGGEDAPIISGKHLDINDCNNHNAKVLLFALLKAHEQMITKPDYFSKDNPTKQNYYGLLNRTINILQLGIM